MNGIIKEALMQKHTNSKKEVKKQYKGLAHYTIEGSLKNVDQSLYQRIHKNKTMLRGEEDDKGVDWAMFDYVLAIPHIFDGRTAPLQALKAFWEQFYTHQKIFLNEYQTICDRFDEALVEQDGIIRNHVGVTYEAKIMEAYFENDQEANTKYKDFKADLERKWVKSSGECVQEPSV